MINIISTTNGVGLEQDALLLQGLIKSKTRILDFNKTYESATVRADISIHLEVVNPRMLSLAKRNILIPNPEWFERKWISYLKSFDTILAKTHNTERIFSALHKNVIYTGFTSRDMHDNGVKKDRIFLHNRGKSSHKGSNTVIEAWRPQFGKMFVNSAKQMQSKPGIIMNYNRLSQDKMQTLINACYFHVCPSEAEGFGHYINEARSAGAIVITTDAAPMNELIRPGFGVLCKYSNTGTHHLGLTYSVDRDALTAAYIQCLNYSAKQLNEMSRAARYQYLMDKKDFITKLNTIL